MNGRLGISLGDPAGIGPEVTLKALAAELAGEAASSYLIIGDAPTCQRLNERLGLGLTLSPCAAGNAIPAHGAPASGPARTEPEPRREGAGPEALVSTQLPSPREERVGERGIAKKTGLLSPALSSFLRPEKREKSLENRAFPDLCRYQWPEAGAPERNAGNTNRLCLLDPGCTLPDAPAPKSPAAARAAVAWLREAAQRCLSGELSAMVTAPVNKHAIVQAGIPFIGQTEMLSEMAGTARTAMMLLGQDSVGRWLRVTLATTHLALRRVPDAITPAKLALALDLAAQSCRELGLSRARVGVCGLNPHAGEGGEFGSEEAEIIAPAIAAARQRGLEVVGPLPGDTVFHQALRGDFDVVVAMYHDQGLGPLKTVAFDTGVNWTIGLPFIRTSPDHGTAYDIAGQGRANPSSMIAALRLARQLAARRAS